MEEKDIYARQKKYFKTEKGKDARHKANKKYYETHKEEVKARQQTEEFKRKKSEYNRRYREKMKELKGDN